MSLPLSFIEPQGDMNAIAPRKAGGSRPHITPRIRAALEHLAYGRADDVPAAARLADMAESSIYVALKKPHVHAEFIRICQHDLDVLGVVRAKAKILALIDSESPYVALDASKTVLNHGRVLRTSEGGRPTALAGGIKVTFITHAAQNGATAVQVDIDPDKIIDGSTI